ncbi:unnamed protein product [Caenorhabditis sp. 36 PRJEB53466]|nr:unnamed protein product [Caenorhabditis sp. 36 PRJEB53466]
MEVSDGENEETGSSRSHTPQPSTSSTKVIQPVFLVILNPADISLRKEGPVPSVQMSFMNQEQIPMIESAVTSNSFATQYDLEPATFCERGTMMNNEEPLSFFDPPFGEEFGDMALTEQKNSSYGFSVPSTSQPQTRSFGTMFDNVETCNTGTSMIDESYVSEFLRDIETQTPSYMIQRGRPEQSQQSSDDWSWRMTDGNI